MYAHFMVLQRGESSMRAWHLTLLYFPLVCSAHGPLHETKSCCRLG